MKYKKLRCIRGRIRRWNAGRSKHILDLSLHLALKFESLSLSLGPLPLPLPLPLGGPLPLSVGPLPLSLGPLHLKMLFYRSLMGPKLGDLSLELCRFTITRCLR